MMDPLAQRLWERYWMDKQAAAPPRKNPGVLPGNLLEGPPAGPRNNYQVKGQLTTDPVGQSRGPGSNANQLAEVKPTPTQPAGTARPTMAARPPQPTRPTPPVRPATVGGDTSANYLPDWLLPYYNQAAPYAPAALAIGGGGLAGAALWRLLASKRRRHDDDED